MGKTFSYDQSIFAASMVRVVLFVFFTNSRHFPHWVNTENFQFVFKCCTENLEIYLAKQENPSLLVSMVLIWIFSMHISKESNSISALSEHDVAFV